MAAPLNVNHAGLKFHTDQRGLVVQKFIVDEPIHIVSLTSPQAQIRYLPHSSYTGDAQGTVICKKS